MSGQRVAAQRRRRGSAATPQVGGSSQEIGVTQSGSSDSGTRNPQMSQTGNSKAVPSAQADAVAHGGDREQEAEQADGDDGHHHGRATNASGCSSATSMPKTNRPQSSVATRL